MNYPQDTQIPTYVLDDFRRLITRISANEHWYEQCWLGVPVWQLPEDLLRLQEIVVEIKPKWIIETGTKFGGSAIFFASMLKLIGNETGGVITIDISQYKEAEATFRTHPCSGLIKKVIIGDASSESVFNEVSNFIKGSDGVTLVFLDDNHNFQHVYSEMMKYSKLVTVGSFLIVADTSFEDLDGTPVGAPTNKYPDVKNSNPRIAINHFLKSRNDFVKEDKFNGRGVSNFNDGFLRKVL